jgi:transmembrane sensor
VNLPFLSVEQPRGEIYSTAVGQSHQVKLADGSSITLNTGSEVEVRYTRSARDLVLNRGEANFDVAKDASRPFNVRVGTRILQAVGTAFNVRLRNESAFEVTVTEGKVKVMAEEQARPRSRLAFREPTPPRTTVEGTLDAHQTATVEARLEDVRRLQQSEIDERLAWQRGMVIFRGETLDIVLREFSRYTTTEFVLADESLRTVQVGGYFPVGQIDDLLNALRVNFGIAWRREGDDRIVLMRADP